MLANGIAIGVIGVMALELIMKMLNIRLPFSRAAMRRTEARRANNVYVLARFEDLVTAQAKGGNHAAEIASLRDGLTSVIQSA